jgi:hypothetical protein
LTYPLPAWQDSPSTATPINSSNLLLYNSAINGITSTISTLQTQLPFTAVQTGAYTATANQYVLVDTTAAPVTVTFPTAPANNTRVGVKQVARGTPDNFVTLQLGGSDKFNTTSGAQTSYLYVLNQGAIWQYNSSTSVWVYVCDDVPLSQTTARSIAMSMVFGSFGVSA